MFYKELVAEFTIKRKKTRNCCSLTDSNIDRTNLFAINFILTSIIKIFENESFHNKLYFKCFLEIMVYSKQLTKTLTKIASRKSFFKCILLLNFVVLLYFIIFYINLNTYTNFSKNFSKLVLNNVLIHKNQLLIVNKTRKVERILLVTNSHNSSITNELVALFESFRYSYKIFHDKSLIKNPKKLTSLKQNHFSLIIINSIEVLLSNNFLEIKQYIFDTSSFFNVGIIIIFESDKKNEAFKRNSDRFTLNLSLNKIDLEFKSIDREIKCNLNKFSSVNNFFHITKFNAENILTQQISDQETISFVKYDSQIFESVLNCTDNTGVTILKTKNESSVSQRILLIGIDLNNLLISSSLMVDFISFASNEIFKNENKRFVQIDIDDIFVGAKNTRMEPDDVQSLIDFQENILNKNVFNSSGAKFKFNLGFSGYYYQSGNEKENKGDELLISKLKHL